MTFKTTSQTRSLRQALGLKSWNSFRSQLEWVWVIDNQNSLSMDQKQVVQGILYGYQTGRFNGTAHMAIRSMTMWQFTALAGHIAPKVKSQSDVAALINALYA